MTSRFTITTPVPLIPVNETGAAQVIFTVTNTSGAPARVLAKVVSSGGTRAEWLSLSGESERYLPTAGSAQFAVSAHVPVDVPEGRYPFRLDIASARKASEEGVEGPVVALGVAAHAAPPRKLRWWIIAAVVVLIVAVIAAIVLSRDKPAPEPIQPGITATVVEPVTIQPATPQNP